MKTKKSYKSDLNKWRLILFEIGLVFALIGTYLVFQIKTSERDNNILGELGNIPIEEEIIPITVMKNKKPKPPVPAKVVEEIKIVDNDNDDIDDEFDFDADADETTTIDQTEIQPEITEDYDDEPIDFYSAQEAAEFPGGNAALFKFISDNLDYPDEAKSNDVTGTVGVKFVIDKQGNVTNVEVVRSVDPYLDREAVRVIKMMPRWKPAQQRGKPVKVILMLPIRFELIK